MDTVNEWNNRKGFIKQHIPMLESPQDTIFECALCTDTFLTDCDRRKHFFKHSNEGLFECPDCAIIYEDLESFYDHTRQHDLNFLPKIDLYDNETKESETSEMFSASNESEDSNAEDNQIDQNDLAIEVQKPEVELKPITASISHLDNQADDSIKSGDFIKHRRKYSGRMLYYCDYCQVAFTQKRNLMAHMHIHTEAPSICKYCKKKFLLQTSYRHHLKKHEGDILLLTLLYVHFIFFYTVCTLLVKYT